MDAPVIGDVFGEMIRDAYAVLTGVGPRPLAGGRVPRPVIEIIERDDGLINGAPAGHYLAEPREWQPHDHRALRLSRGHVLDIGCGAGATTRAGYRRRCGGGWGGCLTQALSIDDFRLTVEWNCELRTA